MQMTKKKLTINVSMFGKCILGKPPFGPTSYYEKRIQNKEMNIILFLCSLTSCKLFKRVKIKL